MGCAVPALEVNLERGREARGPRMSSGDLALGLRVLATLLESGLPIGRALAAMDNPVPPAWNTGFVSHPERGFRCAWTPRSRDRAESVRGGTASSGSGAPATTSPPPPRAQGFPVRRARNPGVRPSTRAAADRI